VTIHNILYEDRFVSSTKSILDQHGIAVTIGHDFEVYRSMLAKARPDHLIGAPFDPDLHKMNESNAFWLIGQNEDGDIMHTQTVRMLDLGGETVGEYLTKDFRAFPPPGLPIDLERSQYKLGPGANRMRGQVGYHGEFWIGGAPGQYRGSGLSSALTRLGFWESLQRWNLDHMIAFMAQAVAFKGLVERAGWMHTDPGALKWYIEGNDTPIDGFMAYIHREDIHFLLDIPQVRELAKAA